MPPLKQPRLALALVRLASRLVARDVRSAWLREWRAELLSRWDELGERGARGLGAHADLLRRAAGSVIDAVTYDGGWWTMEGLGHDVRAAARSLARRPGFSATIVVMLAVGIGVDTAIFGVARDELLRPFPYPSPDDVVSVEGLRLDRGTVGNVSYPNVADLDASATSFTGIAAARWSEPVLEDERGAVVLKGGVVTASFFRVLGVEAGLGRLFVPGEQGEGREPLVVLSHAFWMDRFGGDPAIVGRAVRLSDRAYTVIGVTSSGFEDPGILSDTEAWQPQVWTTVDSPPSEWPRSGRSWRALGRLRRGVSLATAQAELDAIFGGLVTSYPEENTGQAVRITPLREHIAGPARPVLLTLLGAVGILLVIACTNLANLLLGRALDRQGTVALHRALGASAWRILNQGIAEAAILAGTGGALGVLVAVALGRASRGLAPLLPRAVTGSVDLEVLAFGLAVTAGCALLFGLAPAIHSARTGEARPGADGGRGHTASARARRLSRALVVGELALTAGLLVGAGLLLRSFQRLGAVDLGMRTEGVVTLDLHGSAWSGLEAPAAQAQWDQVLAAVRGLPGVEAAGAIDYVPMGGGYSCDGIEPTDQPPPAPGEGRCAEVRVVLPGVLEALGVPLVRGRVLAASDGADGPDVAVVDESMAAEFWPGEDAIGKRMRIHTKVHEVVGIVRDMRMFGPGQARRPMVYLHAPQEGWNGIARGLALVVRGSDTQGLVSAVRGAVAGVNASIAIGHVASLDELLGRTLAAPRFRTGLMLAFGVTALVLAVLGIGGVMSYSVARRTRELGVRLAVGARPADVRGIVVREGLRLTVLGVGLGLALALAGARALEALLFDVSPRDPVVFAAVAATLGLVAMAACYLPGRRAAAVDPVRVLSGE